MRTRWFVVALATIVAIFVYAARCRAAAEPGTASYGYVPRVSHVQTASGSLDTSSYGLALLDVGNANPILALHVRGVVTNSGARPRSLDLQSAALTLPEGDVEGALAINSDPDTLPLVILAPGQQRIIDFYFAMPATVYDATDLAAVDFTWLHRQIAFARIPLETPPALDASAGNQRHWWFTRSY